MIPTATTAAMAPDLEPLIPEPGPDGNVHNGCRRIGTRKPELANTWYSDERLRQFAVRACVDAGQFVTL